MEKNEIIDNQQNFIVFQILNALGIFKFANWEKNKIEFKIFKDNFNFLNKNLDLVNTLNKYFDKISLENVSAMLQVFMRDSYELKEIINFFFSINQIITHLNYFEMLESIGMLQKRNFNEVTSEMYFNKPQNKIFNVYFSNFKTKMCEVGDSLLSNEHENKMSNAEDSKIYYTGIRDRRRNLMLDDKGYFNYICFICPRKHETGEREYLECPYAHNQNEIMYHPLVLKTRKCKKSLCNFDFCYKSHDSEQDFRILYSEESEIVKKIISSFSGTNINDTIKNNEPDPFDYVLIKHEKKPHFNKNLDNKFEILPSEFSPYTYKTINCPLGESCKLDRKLCLNYHDNFERRRDVRKFDYWKYKDTPCKFVYDLINKSWVDPIICREVNKIFYF